MQSQVSLNKDNNSIIRIPSYLFLLLEASGFLSEVMNNQILLKRPCAYQYHELNDVQIYLRSESNIYELTAQNKTQKSNETSL